LTQKTDLPTKTRSLPSAFTDYSIPTTKKFTDFAPKPMKTTKEQKSFESFEPKSEWTEWTEK
jgi:hypothetical protein